MTAFQSISDALRHGLFMQRVIGRLKRFGIDLNPYFLFREGVDVGAMQWPELADTFPGELADPSLASALAERSDWATVDNFRQRFDDGHICFVILHDDAIAAYTWADPKSVNDVSCDFELQPGEAYLYDAFVAPEHRGRGLAPYLRYECYQHLYRLGFTTFYSISDYFNSPAIRFKEKLNAEKYLLYLEIKLGGRRLGQWILRRYPLRERLSS